MKLNRIDATVGAAISLLIYGCFVGSFGLAVSYDKSFLFYASMLWFFLLLGAPLTALAVLLVKRVVPRRAEIAWGQFVLFASAALCAWTLQFAASPFAMGWKLYRAGMESFIKRSQPLIAAIETYEAKQGSAPDRLEQLVPEQLASIPETGLVQREYRYKALYDEKNREAPAKPGKWALSAGTSLGIINFDSIYYSPDPDYAPFPKPELEKIGTWTYHHE